MRILTFSLLLAGILGGSFSAFGQGPELTAENPVFDFGEIPQGETLQHVFGFRNTGNESLVISRVRTSCGCTAALLSASEIPPGERGEVRTTFNSGRFRGPVEKAVYLYSNDPRQAAVTLRLRGKVLPELELVPAQVDLGAIASGGTQEVRIALVNRGQQPLVLRSAQGTHPALQGKIPAGSVAPGEKAEIVLQADRSGGEPVNGYLIIRTDSASTPELRLPVHSAPAAR